MKDYNKKAVGERIRLQRKALGISQEEFAERVERVPRFCADIERGQVGMSIETMLSVCSLLKLTPNELLIGESAPTANTNELELITSALSKCTEKQRKDAYALLKLFLKAIQ
ncbi:XRE family transcriptional regulator [Paenibacillus albiflavus]|uniref:XRE family transcriptional regulator n=1 Tax=Paenibacillus albiflavus TaxID=2545760 RepID=A0A4R4EFW5_9BACL|nr:helix-turn-helix transcriptional regulator [Paenibacillus albiflavus]TCZ78467.1 XRE family transcriptional regulator [Paenibacillus albiflavus]